MSGSLLEIKKKIGGVQNTRKITKAMQLVAASKMRQFQKRAVEARGYIKSLRKILGQNINTQVHSPYTEERESGKTLFVIYTSDKGLCGALNNKIINGLFRSKQWTELSPDKKMLITIGRKSFTYAQSNNIPVTEKFIGISENLTNLDAIEVVDKILALWTEDKAIKEVIFVAPHYQNSFTFYPEMRNFLPLDVEEEEKVSAHDNNFMLHAPSEEMVLQRLYEQVIQASFIRAFLELKASEYSSRMIAMQNATDAATDMISSLKLQFNKARQQAITQEIAELIGASIAMEEQA